MPTVKARPDKARSGGCHAGPCLGQCHAVISSSKPDEVQQDCILLGLIGIELTAELLFASPATMSSKSLVLTMELLANLVAPTRPQQDCILLGLVGCEFDRLLWLSRRRLTVRLRLRVELFCFVLAWLLLLLSSSSSSSSSLLLVVGGGGGSSGGGGGGGVVKLLHFIDIAIGLLSCSYNF